jgi:hypothetical protein
MGEQEQNVAAQADKTEGTDARSIFLVLPLMSSPNKIADTERVDDTHRAVTLEWGQEMRDKITAVRKEYYPAVRAKCVCIYGLSFAKAADMTAIAEVMETADKELKLVHPSLGATVRFVPLSVDAAAKGEVYRQINDAIRGRIYTELFERLRNLPNKVKMNARSRTALVELCDKLKGWNIIDDPDINASLYRIKTAIANDIVAPVMEDLCKEIDDLKGRGAFLEV